MWTLLSIAPVSLSSVVPKRLSPFVPPVRVSGSRRISGIETAKAKVARAR